MIRVCPLSAVPRREALRADVEPPIAVFHTEDSVAVEEGSVGGHDGLAIHRRGDVPVGVLGMNQSRLFGRWRRQLNTAVMV